jgi:hypothetical protein
MNVLELKKCSVPARRLLGKKLSREVGAMESVIKFFLEKEKLFLFTPYYILI